MANKQAPAEQTYLSATLLVIDDDRLLRWTLRQRLEKEGYAVLEAADGASAWAHFESCVDCVLLDERLPDTRGSELLARFVESDSSVPVIMLTAFSSVEQAVAAMQAGAFHYAKKPIDPDELVITIRRALRTTQLERRVRALQREEDSVLDTIVGESEAMRSTKQMLATVATSPSSTVLLTGESGTGKDLAARVLHQLSARHEGPFLNITCSALNESLLESELFGHERGAFTDAKQRKKGLFEQAHFGTLFLDEIGEMTVEMQSKLLRFLEEKAFRRVGGAVDVRANVRIVAATNVNLQQAVREGAFREDLYYRLAVLPIEMPPLRDRDADITLLALHFIERFNREFHKKIKGLAPAAARALRAYSWPGNVRELRNAMERAVLLTRRSTIAQSDLALIGSNGAVTIAEDFELPPSGIDVAALERSLVKQALDRANGNRSLAAKLLGMNRDQIRYRINKFSLKDHQPK
jgi:two-component system response regulator AtoC